jgi:hypothetical protein
LGKETGNEGYLLMTGLWEKEGKRSGSSCWKNEWGFVLLAGQGEENGGNDVERKTKNVGGLCCWLEKMGEGWRLGEDEIGLGLLFPSSDVVKIAPLL